ncbi:hypothetical protein A2U01_0075907, partial [Trifolium medium]|nr:hypothetical protein [Trifolium medium]
LLVNLLLVLVLDLVKNLDEDEKAMVMKVKVVYLHQKKVLE